MRFASAALLLAACLLVGGAEARAPVATFSVVVTDVTQDQTSLKDAPPVARGVTVAGKMFVPLPAAPYPPPYEMWVEFEVADDGGDDIETDYGYELFSGATGIGAWTGQGWYGFSHHMNVRSNNSLADFPTGSWWVRAHVYTGLGVYRASSEWFNFNVYDD